MPNKNEAVPTPYSETPERQATTKGAILFNGLDKQKSLTPSAQEIISDFDRADTERHSAATSPKVLAELALQQAATQGDWDQARIDAAQSAIDKQFADAK